MFQNNPILIKLKKKLCKKFPKIIGTVKSTTKNFGFLEVYPKKTYFISPKNMKKVIHGDKIIGSIVVKNNREVIYPEKLIEPFLTTFIGNIIKKKNIIFVKPYYPYLKDTLLQCLYNLNIRTFWKNGDWVVAQLTQHYLKNNNSFQVKIIEFISKKKNPLAPWYVILKKNNLEKKSPEINDIKFFSYNNILDIRKDLTNLDFITIDSSQTKDIDDALFVEKISCDKFSLIIAIADPTEYFSQNNQIDIIAQKRSFTSYFPGFNIPMLPKVLSEDLCSLKPHVLRPVIACRIIIDLNGNIIYEDLDFFLANIISKSKLSYKNVSNWLEKSSSWVPENKNIMKQIVLLNEVYKIRNKWRKKNALIFPESPEYHFHFSEKLEVLNISIENRRIAHKIIEEFMILANICAAFFLKNNLGFGLYNTHLGFDIFNAHQVSKFLKKYNIIVNPNDISTLKGFCKLHRFLETLPNNYIHNRVRKFQSFGEMSLIPQPHFALGLKCYATWTSPIRKYSDIVNHRLIKSVIIGKTNIKKPNYKIISQILDCRRRNRIAVKELEQWLYVRFFLKNHLYNQHFKANITDIFKHGIKARLLKNGAYVFIPAIYIHKIKEDLILNSNLGIVYIHKKIFFYVTDIITVRLLNINQETNTILASIVN